MSYGFGRKELDGGWSYKEDVNGNLVIYDRLGDEKLVLDPSSLRVSNTKPYVLVTPNGPNDGGDYGPNTPGTTTAGIQEAVSAA